jgi:serine/threonine protein kinase
MTIPTKLTLESGKSLQLGPKLGGGGEGDVYHIQNNPDMVAKIYFAPQRTPQLAAKIRAMVANPPIDPMRSSLHVSIAWPMDVILHNRQFMGFVMPKIGQASVLFELIQPQHRIQKHPKLSHQHIYRVARNYAIAMDAIHQKNYVIGDVNDKNAMFNHQALTTIVDCDSMQITDRNGTIYPCIVGVAEMLAPELHHFDFANPKNVRTPNSDVYSLALIIFKMVMQGFHPFQGVPNKGVPHVEQAHVYCMTNDIFPYLTGQKYTPAPAAPGFECLPGLMRDLFIRAFTEKIRPTAKEWATVLESVEKRLDVCANDPTHLYPSDGYCVMCEVQYNTKRRPRTGGNIPARTMPKQLIQVPLPPPIVPPLPVVPRPPVIPRPSVIPPPPVATVRKAVQVIAANNYSLVLCDDGSVVGCGDSAFMKSLSMLRQVKKICASTTQAVALLQNGRVVSWGTKPFVVPTSLPPLKDIAVGANEIAGVSQSGHVLIWDALGKLQEHKLPDIQHVAMGDRHYVLRDTQGNVRAWGNNSVHQTDIEIEGINYKSIYAAYNATALIRSNGAVKVVGGTPLMQSVPSKARNAIDISIGNNFVIACCSDNSVISWGDKQNKATRIPANLTQVIQVAAGASHVIAIKQNGDIVAWGDNTYGQCDIPKI